MIGFEHRVFGLCLLVAANLSHFFNFLEMLFHTLKIFQLKLGVDNFFIPYGVHTSVNVNHISVVKAAENVDNGIGLAYVSEKLVSQSLAFACAFHNAGYVHDFHRCGNNSSRMDNFGKAVEACVGHSNYSHIGFYGAKGEVCSLRFSTAKTVEQG